MKGINPQSDLGPSPSNCNMNSVFSDELNLSIIDSPNNKMQRTLENIEVENQNLYGSQSNVNPVDIGRLSRPSVLQTSQGSKFIWSWTNFELRYL